MEEADYFMKADHTARGAAPRESQLKSNLRHKADDSTLGSDVGKGVNETPEN